MIVNMNEMLNEAKKKSYAVPHFNINNLEWTRYILEECQQNSSPVILGVSEGAVNYMGGYQTVTNLVKGLVQDLGITIPVCLHLDHGSSYEICKKAIDSGFTSVMIDASRLSLEENMIETKKVIQYARANQVSVEAEIGHVGGEEDGISSDLAYAQIDDVIAFVEYTKLDALAPAVGSSHGLYKGVPKLDFERIEKIRDLTHLPLVLHGGSGIPDEQIKKAIACGICKLNINTDLQVVWTRAVRQFLLEYENVYDPRKVIRSGEKAIRAMIKEKILLLNSQNRVNTPNS